MAVLTLEQKIVEAESAYHALATGTMARVVVDQNGEKIEFAAANRSALYQYIQELKSQVTGATPHFTGPAQFLF